MERGGAGLLLRWRPICLLTANIGIHVSRYIFVCIEQFKWCLDENGLFLINSLFFNFIWQFKMSLNNMPPIKTSSTPSHIPQSPDYNTPPPAGNLSHKVAMVIASPNSANSPTPRKAYSAATVALLNELTPLNPDNTSVAPPTFQRCNKAALFIFLMGIGGIFGTGITLVSNLKNNPDSSDQKQIATYGFSISAAIIFLSFLICCISPCIGSSNTDDTKENPKKTPPQYKSYV
ncbi:hypothetical protein [Paraburkholderia hayleyella]|uniref:hypothetical protein n=1 Tax=Paraburkholderia hayleyella TaxID=2152889 RepID=UPI001291A60F|nr:hypothetical protein [Paraburkholderia hayleyella]